MKVVEDENGYWYRKKDGAVPLGVFWTNNYMKTDDWLEAAEFCLAVAKKKARQDAPPF